MKKYIYKELGQLFPGTEFWYQDYSAEDSEGYLIPIPNIEEKFIVTGKNKWNQIHYKSGNSGYDCNAKPDLRVVVQALVI